MDTTPPALPRLMAHIPLATQSLNPPMPLSPGRIPTPDMPRYRDNIQVILLHKRTLLTRRHQPRIHTEPRPRPTTRLQLQGILVTLTISIWYIAKPHVDRLSHNQDTISPQTDDVSPCSAYECAKLIFRRISPLPAAYKRKFSVNTSPKKIPKSFLSR